MEKIKVEELLVTLGFVRYNNDIWYSSRDGSKFVEVYFDNTNNKFDMKLVPNMKLGDLKQVNYNIIEEEILELPTKEEILERFKGARSGVDLHGSDFKYDSEMIYSKNNRWYAVCGEEYTDHIIWSNGEYAETSKLYTSLKNRFNTREE